MYFMTWSLCIYCNHTCASDSTQFQTAHFGVIFFAVCTAILCTIETRKNKLDRNLKFDSENKNTTKLNNKTYLLSACPGSCCCCCIFLCKSENWLKTKTRELRS